nr:chitobiase/beta-hexosaminidase C-terminal domain-containing protein [uncultured Sphaerochaeta sp.]
MSSRDLKTILFINVELLIIVAFLLVLPFVEPEQTGTLEVTWSVEQGAGMQPLVQFLRITGNEAGGASFTREVPLSEGTLLLEDVDAGMWILTVQALDEKAQYCFSSSVIPVVVRTKGLASAHAVVGPFPPAAAKETEKIPPVPKTLKIASQAVQTQTSSLAQPASKGEDKPILTLEGAVFDQPVQLAFTAGNPKLVSLNGREAVLMDKPLIIERDTIVQIAGEGDAEPITYGIRIRAQAPTITATRISADEYEVSLASATGSAVIRYTLNGESYPYTGPFRIEEGTTLEAVASKLGMQPSYAVFRYLEADKDVLRASLVTELSEEEEPREVVFALHNSDSQTWKVGDIGPAGGFIFYDKGYYADGWRYLEAAPEDEAGTYRWGQYGYYQDMCAVEHGQGMLNCQKLGYNEMPIDCALYACQEKTVTYDSHLYDDWFLPSRDELTTLLQFRDTAGLSADRYWSSSEVSATSAWQVNPATLKASQYYKNAQQSVRAVRSF